MRPQSLILTVLLPFTAASLLERDSCSTGYTLCAPSGATSALTPQIGDPSFPSLFNDILSSNLPSSSAAKLVASSIEAATGTTTSSLCCNTLISCLLMSSLALPFCYDPFTTNYHLPDGSSGTVAFGTYVSATNDVCNLETGAYTLANGTTGNIYSSDPTASPNMKTVVLPTQYTSSGIGSAVPASNLGIEITITYTTTLPGSTIPASTLPPSIIPASTMTETMLVSFTTTTTANGQTVQTVVASSSFSLQVEAASTIPGTTIPGTTVSAMVEVLTTTEVQVGATTATASVSSTSTGKKNGAEGRRVEGWIMGLGMGAGLMLERLV